MAEVGRVLTSFMDKVGFASKIPTMIKATADDEKPTPGYLLKEINKISFESDGAAQCLLDYLLDRLQHRSFYVRIKVLRIMKELVKDGHPDFRNDLRKQSTLVKQCTSCSGPPDPLHGNTPYFAVRQAAHDLLRLLFDFESQRSDERQPSISSGIGSSGGTGKMTGFGSAPVTTQKSLGSNIVSGIRDIAEKVLDSGDNRTFTVEKSHNKIGLYSPAQMMGQTTSSVDMTTVPKHTRRRKKERVVGRALGGWESDDNEDDPDSVSSGSDPLVACERLDVETFSSFQVESRLVEAYLSNTSTPMPSRAEVAAFVLSITSCSLNCDKAAEFLRDSLLNHGETAVNMRILLALEALLRTDVSNVDVLCQLFAKNLLHFLNSPSTPERSKARKIIKVMEKLSASPEVFSAACEHKEVGVHENDRSTMDIAKTCMESLPS